MRTLRLKIDAKFGSSAQHLFSRTNNREKFFRWREKMKLVELIRQAADYCGLRVFTHAVMDNHPHVLVWTPRWEKDPDDAELLRRYRVLNPATTRYRGKRLEVIAAHLAANTEEGIEWRRKQLAQMGDISQFMKIVKQRFMAWFNKRHGRTGTIWGGRFKNMLVMENSGALIPMAAYIDLNAIRAGMVTDPKDFAYCGYGEAVAGGELAREGIMHLMEFATWDRAQEEYRKLLYSVGAKPRATAKGKTISVEDYEAVVAQGGKLSLAEALRCRIRRFTDGVAFGTREWVEGQLATFLKANRRKRQSTPRPMPPITDWGDLCTLRGLRRP